MTKITGAPISRSIVGRKASSTCARNGEPRGGVTICAEAEGIAVSSSAASAANRNKRGKVEFSLLFRVDAIADRTETRKRSRPVILTGQANDLEVAAGA